ncbi:MAG: ferritin [Candidatus Heimdallarchaeota archaeon]
MSRLSSELIDGLNEQIKIELESFYIYHAMATWFESLNWHNASAFFKNQSQEEFQHAEEFTRFLLDIGANVEFKALGQPPSKWGSIKAALDEVLAHERMVTDKISSLFEIAQTNKDFIAYPILQKFLEEQVEEEAFASELTDRYDHFKGDDLLWDHRMKYSGQDETAETEL